MPANREGIFYGWWVLLACIVGLVVGPGQFAFGSLGLFIPSLESEFGWKRGQISLAATVFTVTLIFAMPVVGRLVDRFGSKRVLLPALLSLALCLAAIPPVVSHLWHLVLIFFLIGSLGAAANSLPFMYAISSWFNRKRGLAIGLGMTGSGLGYALVPPLIQHINSKHGWHWGYYTLAAIILFIAIPVILLLFRNTPEEMGLLPDGLKNNKTENTRVASTKTGLDRDQALNDPNFRLLVVIFSMLAFCLFGLLIHLYPMLTDLGMPAAKAAEVQALVGWTIVIVRAPVGILMDHYFAPRIAQVCFVISTIGIALFAFQVEGTGIYVAAILVGFSISAEIDLLAFLASRYFGLLNYGQIFGMLFSSMMLGVSLGPPVFGFCFDIMGDYRPVLYLSCFMLIAATLLTHRLPAYPDFDTPPAGETT